MRVVAKYTFKQRLLNTNDMKCFLKKKLSQEERTVWKSNGEQIGECE